MREGHGLLSARGLGDAAQVFAAHGFRFVFPLLLYPVLTRRLGLEGFGVYAAGLSLAIIVSAVVEYGFAQSGPREVAETEPEARGRIVGVIFAARAMLAGPALLLGATLAWINPVLRSDPFAAAAGAGLGLAQGSSVLWFFQGVRRPGPAVGGELAGQGLAFAAILVWPGTTAAGALAAQALGLGFGVAMGAAMMMREARPVRPLSSAVVKRLRADLPLAASRAVIVGYTGAAVFLVAALAGPVQAALHGAADKVAAAATSFLRPLAGLIAPRISGLLRHDPATAFRTVRWSLMVTAALATAGAAVVFLAAPALVEALFGRDFAAAAPVLRVLILILPLVAAGQALGPQLMTPLRLDRAFAGVVAAGAGVVLAGAFALAPAHGAPGAAWARVAGEVAVAGACLLALRGHWGSLVPGRARRDVPAV